MRRRQPWRRSASFRLRADNGGLYTVVEYTELIETAPAERLSEGRKRLETIGGEEVIALGPNEFILAESGLKLRLE